MAIRKELNKKIPAVGIFVDEPQDHIVKLVRNHVLQMVQLHGHEDEEYIRELKKKISCPLIRVVSVKSREEILKAEKSECEYLLLDNGKGGTGKSFNWDMIPDLSKPWFLAGGIGLNNIREALSLHPYGVDISSGAETNGHKDREKMIELVRIVRSSVPASSNEYRVQSTETR